MQLSIASDLARALDPSLLSIACGITPDPWQRDLLESRARKKLLVCSRQSGKSTTVAMMAAHEALYYAPAIVVVISPSQSQSTELFLKIKRFLRDFEPEMKPERETLTRMTLPNGSQIISLPGNEKSARGFTATLVLIDEAGDVPEEIFVAVRPMLATTEGRLVLLGTPKGRRGSFYEFFEHGFGWERTKVTAHQCPRIGQEFLDDELRDMGPTKFAQEYLCEFHDNQSSAFNAELIEAALVYDFEPFIKAA